MLNWLAQWTSDLDLYFTSSNGWYFYICMSTLVLSSTKMPNTIKHKASSQHLESACILIQWLRLKFNFKLHWRHFMSTFKILLNIVSTITKACIRHLLQILCWFEDNDLNWNQVLICQHLDPWPTSYALLIKTQWLCFSSLSRCSTNFHEILVLCQPPLFNVCSLLCCGCVAKVHRVKVRMQKYFCQSIYVSLNLNWNHTFISSKFQVM